MKFLRAFGKLFLILSLPVLMLLIYNQTVNWHFHLLKDGTIVKHAHPYSNETQGTTPFQKHQHADSEFLFYAQIAQILILLIVLLLAAAMISSLSRIRSKPLNSVVLKPPFLELLSLRGPPSILS
ncbi:MAG: hypothetical protein Q8J88_06500 [Bacteroidales bacterium]|nr:hypothetical protein [Bacteroidales bacterium]